MQKRRKNQHKAKAGKNTNKPQPHSSSSPTPAKTPKYSYEELMELKDKQLNKAKHEVLSIIKSHELTYADTIILLSEIRFTLQLSRYTYLTNKTAPSHKIESSDESSEDISAEYSPPPETGKEMWR